MMFLDVPPTERPDGQARLSRSVNGAQRHPKSVRTPIVRPALAQVEPVEMAPQNIRGGLAPWQIRKIGAHIDQNLASTIRMNDFAAIVRLSTSYFARAFKASFGMTPHAFIVERRIAHAKHLMLATNDPLCQIAMACGMCDQAHLSKLFRRMVGITPNQWRRQRRAVLRQEPMAA